MKIGVWTEDEAFIVCRNCVIRNAGGDEIIGDADAIAQRRREAEDSLTVEDGWLYDGERCDNCGDCWEQDRTQWIKES